MLVRVIEVGDYAESASLIRDIVIRSNSQNAISPVDLVACDQRQVEIERFFRAKKRTYIRRRGQEILEMGARAGARVRSARLAQILACCHRKHGVAVAGGSKRELFQNDTYRELFVEPPLEEIFAKYCLFEVTEAGRRSASQSVRNKYRYVWRNVLAAAWRIVDDHAELRRGLVLHDRITNLSLDAARAHALLRVLREMHQFGWDRYTAARARSASLKADHFFFGDAERANDLVSRIEEKYRSRLAKAMRIALAAP